LQRNARQSPAHGIAERVHGSADIGVQAFEAALDCLCLPVGRGPSPLHLALIAPHLGFQTHDKRLKISRH
jgi:hypothetical protein